MPGKITSKRFRDFVKSQDTFRVYRGKTMLFASHKDRLAPVLEYMEKKAPFVLGVTVYDRIVGNAAALLLKAIGTTLVYSELGSENAIHTLEGAGIRYRFNKTVACIMNDSGDEMCPMEKLSLGKTPEEFHRALKAGIPGKRGGE